MSPLPSRRQPSRSAISRSFIVPVNGTSDRHAIEESRESRQVQSGGDLRDTVRPRRTRQMNQTSEFGQFVARLEGPGDLGEPLTRAAPRLPVTERPERKVPGDDVRPGHEEEQRPGDARRDEVDETPPAVMNPGAKKNFLERRLRIGGAQGRRETRGCRICTAKRPQRPL